MHLTISYDDTSPVVSHDATQATQLVNAVLGTNLRELFPITAQPVRWEPEAALMAIQALQEQSRTLASLPSFPGLFGMVPEPQDPHDLPESEIPEEDRSRIQWKQQYTKGDASWLRFSFETPIPLTQEGESTPDPRLAQLEQELSALQTFLESAQGKTASIAVTTPVSAPTPGTPTSDTPAPTPTPEPVPVPTPEATPEETTEEPETTDMPSA